jgi:hypothetical protein
MPPTAKREISGISAATGQDIAQHCFTPKSKSVDWKESAVFDNRHGTKLFESAFNPEGFLQL